MSRRDSRVHISERQSDALLEFENFKKKFLLANRHITKLNSTLSLRIEELNAHISTLYVENLRLRASEIALTSQLKREKEKSYKIMADTETATMNLLKHLGVIRQNFNLPPGQPPSPPQQTSQPRAKRPPPRSPSNTRLAQPPSVPGISEDLEPLITSCDEVQIRTTNLKDLPIANKARLSTSRLPLPLRVSSPPPIGEMPYLNLAPEQSNLRKRKPLRRHSGLLTVSIEPNPRPASPVPGSPIEEMQTFKIGDGLSALPETVAVPLMIDGAELEDVTKKGKKERKGKTKDRGSRKETHVEREDRRKLKDKDLGGEERLRDVTNSPRSAAVVPVTENPNEGRDHGMIPESRVSIPQTALAIPISSLSPTSEHAPLSTPLPPSPTSASAPRHSKILQPFPVTSDLDAAAAAGREKRVRKSINYAEPKLNTKMRKPDATAPPGARPSLTLVGTPHPTPTYDGTHSSPNSWQDAPEALLPTPSLTSSSTEPDPTLYSQDDSPPRPPSRTSSHYLGAVKRKKPPRSPRRQLLGDGEDDDDGADADAEFSDFKSAWVNVEGRRRSTQSHTKALTANAHRKKGDDEDGRRHSLAV